MTLSDSIGSDIAGYGTEGVVLHINLSAGEKRDITNQLSLLPDHVMLTHQLVISMTIGLSDPEVSASSNL